MNTTQLPYLSDAEVDDMCSPLKQNAAKVRYLTTVLRLAVNRKPDGRPLVWRADLERVRAAESRSGGPQWTKA
jgi:hypothetical protein